MNIDMKKTGKYMLSIYSLFVVESGNSSSLFFTPKIKDVCG